MLSAPDFLSSPYFVDEPDNWHLLPGAPEDVQREFDEFMRRQKESHEDGVAL